MAPLGAVSHRFNFNITRLISFDFKNIFSNFHGMFSSCFSTKPRVSIHYLYMHISFMLLAGLFYSSFKPPPVNKSLVATGNVNTSRFYNAHNSKSWMNLFLQQVFVYMFWIFLFVAARILILWTSTSANCNDILKHFTVYSRFHLKFMNRRK